MRTRRSAVHRDVIADVADNVGHATSVAESTEASAYVHLKRFQLAPSGGGGTVYIIRENLNCAVETLKAKTRSNFLAGSTNAPGTQIIQGALNLSHLLIASSRTGVGRARGFGFVPMLRRMFASAVVLTEC